MFFREGDVVYWNDPSGKCSQSGVIVTKAGKKFKLLLGDGTQVDTDIDQLEVM